MTVSEKQSQNYKVTVEKPILQLMLKAFTGNSLCCTGVVCNQK